MTMTLTHSPRLTTAEVERRWFLIDAQDVVLGRLACMAADLLRGKGKPTFSPDMDGGDGVIVINAGKIRLTGNKHIQKIDFRASRYPGGQVYTQYGKLLKEKPERAVELAVYGMLPKNRLRDRFMRRLKVSRGEEMKSLYVGAHAIDIKNPKWRSGGPYVPASAAQEKKGKAS
jgi:large subunit ribosomal protein L13